jgi:hypothetical protein
MATVTAGYTWTSGETVTPAKLNSAAAPTVVVANDEITTAKILDGNVTAAKIADSNVTAAKLASNAVETAKIADDAVTNAKLSLAANDGEIKKAINADNAAPIYACRAWVNFDGTRNESDTGASANGANVKIRASGNVSSVLKNGTGDYTINFTAAMPDANYADAIGGRRSPTGSVSQALKTEASTKTTSTFRILTGTTTGNAFGDHEEVSVAIFR